MSYFAIMFSSPILLLVGFILGRLMGSGSYSLIGNKISGVAVFMASIGYSIVLIFIAVVAFKTLVFDQGAMLSGLFSNDFIHVCYWVAVGILCGLTKSLIYNSLKSGLKKVNRKEAEN